VPSYTIVNKDDIVLTATTQHSPNTAVVMPVPSSYTPAIAKEHEELPLVPESVLRRRHDLEDLKRKWQANDEDAGAVAGQRTKFGGRGTGKKGGKQQRRGMYVKKPETFLAQAKHRRNEQIRYRRVKKKGMQKKASDVPIKAKKELAVPGNTYKNNDSVDGENPTSVTTTTTVEYQSNSVGAPYVFVIRIREDQGKPPQCVLNLLRQLRLKRPNTGVFVRYAPATRRHLHLIEPWVVYGKPSDGMVRDLLERRAYGMVQNGGKTEKVPLSDNTIIEQALGNDHGILCLEDMVHEIVHLKSTNSTSNKKEVGDSASSSAFDAVATFLCPFPLSPNRSQLEKNLLSVKYGKDDYGDRGDEIDEYIKQML
jgi:60S ribosomal protein uL30